MNTIIILAHTLGKAMIGFIIALVILTAITNDPDRHSVAIGYMALFIGIIVFLVNL